MQNSDSLFSYSSPTTQLGGLKNFNLSPSFTMLQIPPTNGKGHAKSNPQPTKDPIEIPIEGSLHRNHVNHEKMYLYQWHCDCHLVSINPGNSIGMTIKPNWTSKFDAFNYKQVCLYKT